MENLQTKINPYLGVAIPGTLVEGAGSYSLINEGVVADGNVVVGGFVFAGATPGELTGHAVAGAVPLGVALNSRYYTGSGDALGQQVPIGANLGYAVHGVVAILAPATATMGQAVNIDPTTGAVTIGTASGGAIDTGWKVHQGAPANGVMFIVN